MTLKVSVKKNSIKNKSVKQVILSLDADEYFEDQHVQDKEGHFLHESTQANLLEALKHSKVQELEINQSQSAFSDDYLEYFYEAKLDELMLTQSDNLTELKISLLNSYGEMDFSQMRKLQSIQI